MQGFSSARASYSYARDFLGASAPANAAATETFFFLTEASQPTVFQTKDTKASGTVSQL